MIRKLIAGLSAAAFAALSATAAMAACNGHTAEAPNPVQTADISGSGGSDNPRPTEE